eukprot:TRINITY_DN26248_c0_g1_i1.p1 TRINITY_DN26248_c0_g1~~TRINITY_DN26248_c0_g1_i1.p1  ORF type:complete len:268 (+),score=49.70 TRINITY_DN26248_c0_g1_i1:86-889(+)
MYNPRYHFLINRPKYEMIQTLNEDDLPLEGDGKEEETILVYNYICTGKLTLFPAIIIFLGCGAGWLLTFGDKGYSAGYFDFEYKYGIAGILLLVLALALLASLLIWLVLRVSFIITPTHFKIMKSGLLRSSTLEFDVNLISLHYCRTHFIEERSWLQLLVRENNQFYQIFSWKGKGDQKDRFEKLFKALKSSVKLVQQKNRSSQTKMNTEIVSMKERNLIGPFTDRLRQISSTNLDQEHPLCIEDLPLVSFDSFFNHFKLNKKLEYL